MTMFNKIASRNTSYLVALIALSIFHVSVAAAAGYQSRDDSEVTALMRAARDGERQNLKALIEQGVDLNAKDSYGWTALVYATIRGDLYAVKALLDNGADANVKSDSGHTALHSAAQYGHLSIVKELIEKGADLNQSDDNGMTPLMQAASSGNSDLVKYLLAKGADVNASNKRGQTALSIARTARRAEVAEVIKKSGGVEGQDVNSNQEASQQDATKPVLLGRIEVSYTELARKMGTEGTVRARILVGKDGTVKRVRVVSGLPHGLSYQAIDAAYQLRFKPATKGGQPTDFWMPVIIDFRIKR